ncbi:MAG: DUF503 domain-containing protein [Deltaproteobacteria bacterium]|nr:DUF503 domain-containing protein [Deltaproteobacteria bacterium]
MKVGVCHIGLLIHDSHSLKAKRMVLRKLTDNLRNRFNVSVAEVGSNDLWQRAELGVAVVGTDASHVNSQLDNVLNFIESMHVAEVVSQEIELINVAVPLSEEGGIG